VFSFFDYFTDPILRAPTLGSMLMCLASALVGVIVFIRRRSLIGEALSHASYPGVVLGAVFASGAVAISENIFALSILSGAFIASFLALIFLELLNTRFLVKNDAALCFILSAFFGVGVLLASRVQFTHALAYQKIQSFLYGQAATLDDSHIVIYAILSLACIAFAALFYRLIQVSYFDRTFASTLGIPLAIIDSLFHFVLILAIVIGIRSVGLVLMSGMLIAPAVAARQFTHRLSLFFLLAGVFGMCSAFLGNLLSIAIPERLHLKFSLPTGPTILVTASFFALLSLLFAPKRGLVSRMVRILKFKEQCRLENILKGFCKSGRCILLSFSEIAERQSCSHLHLRWLLQRLKYQGWLEKRNHHFVLTAAGAQRALKIIRLHRLWEVYLVNRLGQGAGYVHRSAEEMEHILTPELEKELTEVLGDPQKDPHEQPIPPKQGEFLCP
jgi:manganese/zinc/iron transport system permease protein